ncbi:hypothetical protein BKA01_007946 [Pseudonocardia eucalypti]|nr:hypothetical protein [Pseudonocardia eucalypti]
MADLAQVADLGLTTASAHLQILKQAGLVATSREGTTIYYRLADGPHGDVTALYAHLRAVATERMPDVQAARDRYLGPDDTEHITRDELLRRAQAGQVTVLDVRPAAEYTAGHVPARSASPSTNSPNYPPTRKSSLTAEARTAYSPTTPCASSPTTNRPAQRLTDGILEWRLNNLPVA